MIKLFYNIFNDFDKLIKCDTNLYNLIIIIKYIKNQIFDKFYIRFKVIIISQVKTYELNLWYLKINEGETNLKLNVDQTFFFFFRTEILNLLMHLIYKYIKFVNVLNLWILFKMQKNVFLF